MQQVFRLKEYGKRFAKEGEADVEVVDNGYEDTAQLRQNMEERK